jgi:hypothetical protein
MKTYGFISLLALASCGSAHPLSGLRNNVTADAGAFSFSINYSADAAEATRTNRVWRPEYAVVQAAAIQAVAKGTGCTPVPGSVTGDIALVKMKIDCTASAGPPPAASGTNCSGNATPDAFMDLFDIEIDCRPGT